MASTNAARKPRAAASALKEVAVSAVSTEAIVDLIGKLGVKDLLIDKMRARLEDIELDDVIDDAVDYIRRNPEVLVVLLAAVTVAAGVIVFLEDRREEWFIEEIEDEDDDEDVRPARTTAPRPASRPKGNQRKSA